MKYGESAFDIIYLAAMMIIGVVILIKSHSKAGKLMGAAAVVLGFGDAFHLIPRVLNYFVDAYFSAALGIGKLITSVTMTVFYVIVYHIMLCIYDMGKSRTLTAAVYSLAALRVILCAFPQNGWLENDNGMTWGIIRNIPFALLGILIVVLFFKHRAEYPRFRFIWLWVTLSFAFYIPVAVFAGLVPMLGMLMIPKTVCYVVMVITFYLSAVKDKK